MTIKNANTNKRINIYDKTKLELSGDHARNYTFSDASGADNSGLTGTVIKKVLGLKWGAFNPITKVYDGNTSVAGASVTPKANETRAYGAL